MKNDLRNFPTDKILVSPSLLAADFCNLGSQVKEAADGGAELLHLDVMDGAFVPNISFGVPVIESLRKATDICFDVHLMIEHPKTYASKFAAAGADHITFHVESSDDPNETIDEIHALGLSAGLSLRPKTPASAIFPYLDKLELVLVMTVEPGFGGQSFMSDQLGKIAEIKKEIKKRNLKVQLEVDGGVGAKTAPLVAAAGANMLVAGTSVFRAEGGMAKAISQLRSVENLLDSDLK